MSFVEPFDRGVVEQHLRESGLKFMQDQDGDFFAMFSATERRPEMQVSLSAEGDGAVYAIRVHTPDLFPAKDEAIARPRQSLEPRISVAKGCDRCQGRWNRAAGMGRASTSLFCAVCTRK